MHVKRRLRRVLRGTGRYDRTAALLPWASVLGAPLPLGAGLDAYALNPMGLGVGALPLDRFVVRRPAGSLITADNGASGSPQHIPKPKGRLERDGPSSLPATAGPGHRQHNAKEVVMTTATTAISKRTKETAAAETELRAAARRRGLTMKDLAAKMGVTPGYLSGVATGRKPWTPKMREKAVAVLGEVPGQGIIYRQRRVVNGESSYIRERARELGMSMQDLAERVGVTPGYMTQVSRGQRNMGVKVQARVESALEAPAKVAPAKRADVDRSAVWDRMDAHGLSQNEVAPTGRRQHRASVADHVRQGQPLAGRAEEAARGPVPAGEGRGAGHAGRGEGAGLAEGRAERDGRTWRRWAWKQGRRRDHSGRRPCALGCQGRVRVPHGVRRQGPGLDDARGRAGLLRHADATGVGRGLVPLRVAGARTGRRTGGLGCKQGGGALI